MVLQSDPDVGRGMIEQYLFYIADYYYPPVSSFTWLDTETGYILQANYGKKVLGTRAFTTLEAAQATDLKHDAAYRRSLYLFACNLNPLYQPAMDILNRLNQSARRHLSARQFTEEVQQSPAMQLVIRYKWVEKSDDSESYKITAEGQTELTRCP